MMRSSALLRLNRIGLTIFALFLSTLAQGQQYDGVLVWSKRVTLTTLSSGVVEKVFVDVGDRVKQGDLLLQLDPMVFEKRIKQTAIGLKSANENYLEAKREKERAEELYNRTVLSDHDLQVAKNHLIQSQAELELARVKHEKAKYDFKYSRIIAPFNALVLQRQVEPGLVVSSELQPLTLLIVADSEHMRARIGVNEDQLSGLSMQKSANVKVGDDMFAGKIVAIGFEPVSKKDANGFYPVDVEFETAGKVLRAGLSAKVSFE